MAKHPTRSTQRGNGKLLITGEYLVLDGALALALPVSFGQKLEFTYHKEPTDTLRWKSLDHNGMEWVNKTYCKSEDQALASRDEQSFLALLI